MNPAEFWKNFELGEELSIAGAFIYNGIRRFYELRKLDCPDELFEVLYNLSVGLERLLKVAVVLLEHSEDEDQRALEQSLITHNHLELLHRIKKRRNVNLASPHKELLSLLAKFYKSTRYDRFSLSSIKDLRKERDALCQYFANHLKVKVPDEDFLFGTPNEERYKKFVQKVVQKICCTLYDVVRSQASALNLYTYELRHGSKAETVFLGQANIYAENVLWKELLIYFMNTKSTSGYLKFLRDIEPLDFDPECIDEYLDCFQSDAAKSFVVDEMDHLYEELEDTGQRLQMIQAIGEPGVCFDELEEEQDSDYCD